MRVAAIQAAPAFLDRAATLEIILARMREAAQGGARLCVFPETFWPGYPFWVDITDASHFDDARQKRAYAAYLAASVDPEGGEMAQVIELSRELGLFTYLGFVERSRSGGSVYCSLAAIDPEAGLVTVHRKLRPTYGERLVWSPGDAAGLRVHRVGEFTVGALNCWENWMPLARFSLYAQGEQLHVSAWPGAPHLTRDITRFIAQEGRVYTLASGAVLREEHVPDEFPLRQEVLAVRDRFLSGGSMVVAPSGEVIAEAAKHEETILFADLDLEQVLEARQNFDPAGHYNRPDLFRLDVDRRRLEALAGQPGDS